MDCENNFLLLSSFPLAFFEATEEDAHLAIQSDIGYHLPDKADLESEESLILEHLFAPHPHQVPLIVVKYMLLLGLFLNRFSLLLGGRLQLFIQYLKLEQTSITLLRRVTCCHQVLLHKVLCLPAVVSFLAFGFNLFYFNFETIVHVWHFHKLGDLALELIAQL